MCLFLRLELPASWRLPKLPKLLLILPDRGFFSFDGMASGSLRSGTGAPAGDSGWRGVMAVGREGMSPLRQ